MQHDYYDRNTFFLVNVAIISLLLTIASFVLFIGFVSIGMDFGIFVLFMSIFSYIAFISSLVSLIVIILFHKRFKGLIYSILVLILISPLVVIQTEIFISSPKHREEMKKTHSTLYNMELLAKELEKYDQSHNGYLPDANQWCDILMKENPELTVENFRHPQVDLIKLKGKCHIAFNKELSGILFSSISPDTILLFEADGDWNLNGTTQLLRKPYGEKIFKRILTKDDKDYAYWDYEDAIRKFKSEFGQAKMYYEQPRWEP